jgi:hypothetical protein
MSKVCRRAFLNIAAIAPVFAGGRTAECDADRSTDGLTLAAFRQYIDAFNRGDLETACAFMAPELVFEGTGRHLVGRDAFRAYYEKLRERIHEQVSPQRICFGEDSIAVEMLTELHVLRDWPDFATGPVKQGDVIRVTTFVFYRVRDARFVHIRSARFARQQIAG